MSCLHLYSGRTRYRDSPYNYSRHYTEPYYTGRKESLTLPFGGRLICPWQGCGRSNLQEEWVATPFFRLRESNYTSDEGNIPQQYNRARGRASHRRAQPRVGEKNITEPRRGTRSGRQNLTRGVSPERGATAASVYCAITLSGSKIPLGRYLAGVH